MKCMRCHGAAPAPWQICANCQDPERMYDAEGRPHGPQLLHNGNQALRAHGVPVEILTACGYWSYTVDGLLCEIRDYRDEVIWTPENASAASEEAEMDF